MTLSTKYTEVEIMNGIDAMTSFISFKKYIHHIDEGSMNETSASDIMIELTKFVEDIKRGRPFIKMACMELTSYEKHIFDIIDTKNILCLATIDQEEIESDMVHMTTLTEYIVYYNLTKTSMLDITQMALVTSNMIAFNYFWNKLKVRCIYDYTLRIICADKLFMKAIQTKKLAFLTKISKTIPYMTFTNSEIETMISKVVESNDEEMIQFIWNYCDVHVGSVAHTMFSKLAQTNALVAKCMN